MVRVRSGMMTNTRRPSKGILARPSSKMAATSPEFIYPHCDAFSDHNFLLKITDVMTRDKNHEPRKSTLALL